MINITIIWKNNTLRIFTLNIYVTEQMMHMKTRWRRQRAEASGNK